MRNLLITVALMLAPGALFAADFNAGMTAYERQDYTTAAREFSALAETGDQYAQYMLGRLYEKGNGVVQDYVQAHKWYNLAASRGSDHAALARDALAKQMPSGQASKAQRLASAWKPGAVAATTTASPRAWPATAAANAPWRRLVLHDAFQDGDYTTNPVWTVTAGRFAVEAGLGLRTVHEPRKAPTESRSEDLPMAILGAILAQATRPSGSGPATEAPDYAEIFVDGNITNAFAIQLKISLREAATGPLAFGPYQAGDRSSGYRLVYTPDVERGLHLVRLSASGSSVIESVEAKFPLNREYSVEWTRDQRGEMTVSLDGKEVIRVIDRSLADPFTGFTLVNRGGDYALREITVYGID